MEYKKLIMNLHSDSDSRRREKAMLDRMDSFNANIAGLLPFIEKEVKRYNEYVFQNNFPYGTIMFFRSDIAELTEDFVEFMFDRRYVDLKYLLIRPSELYDMKMKDNSETIQFGLFPFRSDAYNPSININSNSEPLPANLNINSTDDDNVEAQDNSNNSDNFPLEPGFNSNEEHYFTVEKQIKELLDEYDEQNYECLDLNEDLRQISESIEAIIPSHDEAIVTRSFAKKLGDKGIETFDLEVKLESNLKRKRKNLAKKQELVTNLVNKYLPDINN